MVFDLTLVSFDIENCLYIQWNENNTLENRQAVSSSSEPPSMLLDVRGFLLDSFRPLSYLSKANDLFAYFELKIIEIDQNRIFFVWSSELYFCLIIMFVAHFSLSNGCKYNQSHFVTLFLVTLLNRIIHSATVRIWYTPTNKINNGKIFAFF